MVDKADDHNEQSDEVSPHIELQRKLAVQKTNGASRSAGTLVESKRQKQKPTKRAPATLCFLSRPTKFQYLYVLVLPAVRPRHHNSYAFGCQSSPCPSASNCHHHRAHVPFLPTQPRKRPQHVKNFSRSECYPECQRTTGHDQHTN